MTQKDLAKLLGSSGGNISEILAGKRRVSPKTALKFEEKSGVERLVWLYGSPEDLLQAVEQTLGKRINFGRGRIPAHTEEQP